MSVLFAAKIKLKHVVDVSSNLQLGRISTLYLHSGGNDSPEVFLVLSTSLYNGSVDFFTCAVDQLAQVRSSPLLP